MGEELEHFDFGPGEATADMQIGELAVTGVHGD